MAGRKATSKNRPVGKRGGTKKRPSSKSKDSGGQIDGGRSVAGVVIVLAFLVAAALFPWELLGPRVMAWFPSGNPVGSLGGQLDQYLRAWLGLGSWAVPVGLVAAATTAQRWMSSLWLRRTWVLSGALALLLPMGAFLTGGGPRMHGYLGEFVAGPILSAVGPLGAWMLVGAGVLGVTFSFNLNPLQAMVTAAHWVVGQAGRARAALSKSKEKKAKRRADELLAQRAIDAERRALQDGMTGGAGGSAGDEASVELDGPGDLPAVAPAVADGLDMTQATQLPVGDSPLPSVELLAAPEPKAHSGAERELDRLGEVLIEVLATFGIRCEMGGRTTGPSVTRYEVIPAAGVKVNRIANLDADLALALKARSIRIVAPIPGKGAVGVEIPNPNPQTVLLREVLESPAFVGSRGALPLALGRNLEGEAFVYDLVKMPHALIAGATGSGKSVCLNTIITSLVYRHGPDRLRLLLIDPKMVELSAYADLPHLRHPVVTDPKDAAGLLKWAVMEMERRYALLSANGVRSLDEFNRRVEDDFRLRLPVSMVPDPPLPEGDGLPKGDETEDESGPEPEERWLYKEGPLPYVVVVVDELADLMMTVQAEVEKPLAQLAQKARAIGIHLLVATQRPSVNVITGLIKANFPSRIAFRVASKTDSRTILDQNGADSLLGYGDMLFLPPDQSEPVRMQGAYISTDETEALMRWYREQADTLEAIRDKVSSGEEDILDLVRASEDDGDESDDTTFRGDWDSLFREAAEICIQQGAGSTSLLQRRLRIGYGRAARIVDQLNEAGVLGPPDGSKPREVLVSSAALDEICPI